MPSDGSDVTFTGYWATGQSTVWKTQSTVTLSAGSAASPTQQPSEPPTRLPTYPPSPVPTFSPTPVPTYGPGEPTPGPTLPPTPEPTVSPTLHPTPDPTQAPTLAPTQSVNSYTVSMTVTLAGLSVDDVVGDESSIEELIATELGVASDRVVILKSYEGSRRLSSSFLDRLGVRRLSSAATIEFLVTDFATSTAASTALTNLETYVEASGGSSFVSDLNTALSTSASAATVDASGTVDSSLGSTLANYDHNCVLGSGSQKIYWKVSDDASSVSMLMYLSGAGVTDRWVAMGLVPQAAASMVASDGNPHKVYLYKPDVPSAALYDMTSYSPSGFAVDSTARPDGVTGIDVIESGDDYVFMAASHSDNTGVAADIGLSVGSGLYNRVIWAAGAAAWPSSHESGTYGFVDVYWADGQCSEPTVEIPISLWIVFIPLIPAILVASRLSFMRVWADRRKDASDTDEASCLGSLLLLQTWRKGRMSRLPATLFSSVLSEAGAWLFGVDPAKAVEYSVLGYLAVALHLVLNIVVIAVWHADGSSSTSLVRAFGAAALMNFWVALIPTAKGSVVLYLTGVPFERAVKYHRIATTTGAFLATIHLLLHLSYLDTSQIMSGALYGMRGIRPVYGLLAFVLVVAMAVMSISYTVRRHHYRVFIWVHQLWFPAILLMMLHVWMSPYSLASGFIPGLVLQVMDKAWRAKEALFTPHRGYVRAVMTEVGSGSDESKGQKEEPHLVVLSVPHSSPSSFEMRAVLRAVHDWLFDHGDHDNASARLSGNTRATMESFDGLAQYYFVNVPSVSLTEWHPISVSQRGETSSDGTTTFHIKATGPWTQALARLAVDGTLEKGAMPTRAQASAKEVGVALDGPYGSLHIDLSAYSDLVLIAGGIGITPIANILERLHALNNTSLERKLRYPLLKRVTVVWVFKQSCETAYLREFGDRLLGGAAAGIGSRSEIYTASAKAEKGGGSSRSGQGKSAGKTAKSKRGGREYALTATNEHEFAIAPTTTRSGSGVVAFEVHCYSTSVSSDKASSSAKAQSKYTQRTASGAVLGVQRGRPALQSMLASVATGALRDGGRCGVVCCGPRTLSLEVSSTCSEMSESVDLHLEAFQY